MKNNPKILVAQMEISPNNPKENFIKIKSFFAQAKHNNCDFIVFPEYCDGVIFPEFFDKKHPDRFLKTMQILSKENNIYCIAGSILEKVESKFYNSSYAISKNGDILGKCSKKKLHPRDENHLEQGRNELIFETEFGKIGVLICRDMVYPELTKSLKDKGVKIIFCPTFWNYFGFDYNMNTSKIKTNFPVDADINFLKICPQARAIENEVFFIVANAGGQYHLPRHKEELAGHSSVNCPLHGDIQSLNSYDEGMIITKLNLDYIEDSKNTFSLSN
jgi:predicted amidohydrolase